MSGASMEFDLKELPVCSKDSNSFVNSQTKANFSENLEGTYEKAPEEVGGSEDGKTADIEDGEILEEAEGEDSKKTVCRHYQLGRCLYGQKCRFLHVSDKGYYSMFDSLISYKNRGGDMHNRPPPPYPFSFETVFPVTQTPKDEIETFWDRALIEAKRRVELSRSRKKEGYYSDDKLYMTIQKSNRRESLQRTKRFVSKSPSLTTPSPDVYKYKENKIRKTGSRSSYCVARSTYLSDWRDPWRRSKSPPKRKRHLSRSTSSSDVSRSSSSRSEYFRKRIRSRKSRRSQTRSCRRVVCHHRKRQYSHSWTPDSSLHSYISGRHSRYHCKRRSHKERSRKSRMNSRRPVNNIKLSPFWSSLNLGLKKDSPPKVVAEQDSVAPSSGEDTSPLAPSPIQSFLSSSMGKKVPPIKESDSHANLCHEKKSSPKVVPIQQNIVSSAYGQDNSRQPCFSAHSSPVISRADLPSPGRSCSDMSISPFSDSSLSAIFEPRENQHARDPTGQPQNVKNFSQALDSLLSEYSRKANAAVSCSTYSGYKTDAGKSLGSNAISGSSEKNALRKSPQIATDLRSRISFSSVTATAPKQVKNSHSETPAPKQVKNSHSETPVPKHVKNSHSGTPAPKHVKNPHSGTPAPKHVKNAHSGNSAPKHVKSAHSGTSAPKHVKKPHSGTPAQKLVKTKPHLATPTQKQVRRNPHSETPAPKQVTWNHHSETPAPKQVKRKLHSETPAPKQVKTTHSGTRALKKVKNSHSRAMELLKYQKNSKQSDYASKIIKSERSDVFHSEGKIQGTDRNYKKRVESQERRKRKISKKEILLKRLEEINAAINKKLFMDG